MLGQRSVPADAQLPNHDAHIMQNLEMDLTTFLWFRYKLSKPASNRGRRRIVDPSLEFRSLLAIVLKVVTVTTRLDDKNQARDNVLRVQVQNAMNVDDI